MYQALYRKWRPRGFGDVVGQEHITETLRRQIISGRLSHAYLFVGTRGTGKTTCAKILSRAVNCETPVDGSPCNACRSCLGIENGSILDVLELDAASNNGVDNVRALRDEAVYTPAAVKKRVYIIDEVHMLSTAAFNALLKILEEPPEHLMFILATTELHKVPNTILSRCQRFSFKRLDSALIAGRLSFVAEREGLKMSAEAAEKLSRLADGSMRDALSLLDQCASGTVIDLNKVLDTIGLAGNDEIVRLAASAAGHDPLSALLVLDGLYNDGKDMASLLGEIAALIRDALIFKLSPASPLLSGSFDAVRLREIADAAAPERLFYCLDVIKDALYALSRGGNTHLAAEMCIIKMSDERSAEGVVALASRVAQIENQLRGAALVPAEKQIPPPDLKPDSTVLDKEPEIIPANAPETPRDGDFWPKILELLKNDPPMYTLLSDSAQVSAQLRDGTVIISAGNSFAVNTISANTFSEPLKKTAEKVLGRPVSLRVELSGNKTESGSSKLEQLSAFDIIKFE